MQETITLTFGDRAENHVGMQILGKLADEGFTIRDLEEAQQNFERVGCTCELIRLNSASVACAEEAAILVVRHGVDVLCDVNADTLLIEQQSLDWDKKMFAYGRVVQKHARHNLCFASDSQEPDYASGKGRVVSFNDLPALTKIRQSLPRFFGMKADKLVCEGNRYYDTTKTGIGYHGDAERRKVIAVRLGADFPLQYQWFREGRPIGPPIRVNLHHGDIYVMSQKATGTDWRKKKEFTLRHAAGSEKFLKLK